VKGWLVDALASRTASQALRAREPADARVTAAWRLARRVADTDTATRALIDIDAGRARPGYRIAIRILAAVRTSAAPDAHAGLVAVALHAVAVVSAWQVAVASLEAIWLSGARTGCLGECRSPNAAQDGCRPGDGRPGAYPLEHPSTRDAIRALILFNGHRGNASPPATYRTNPPRLSPVC